MTLLDVIKIGCGVANVITVCYVVVQRNVVLRVLSNRTANKKQITKAYRELAAIWHPDKYEGEDKAMAEKKFIDIAAAKEVLSDPGTSVLYCGRFSCKPLPDWSFLIPTLA